MSLKQGERGLVAGTRDTYESHSDVRAVLNDDGGVVIHLRTGSCFLLNKAGANIWRMLLDGKATKEIIEVVSDECDLPIGDAQEDIKAFVQKLQDAQLLSRHSTQTKRCEKPLSGLCRKDKGSPAVEAGPTLFEKSDSNAPYRSDRLFVAIALLGLFVADLTLALCGFRVLYNIVKHWRTSTETLAHDRVAQICFAVDRASTYYFKRSWCLQRSAVAACMLRASGIPAELVIGCRTMPFAAHAWVEVEGSVVGSKGNFRNLFSVLERC